MHLSNRPTYPAQWLALREPADAVARSGALVKQLRELFEDRPSLTIRDLGCGIGSMGRWLSPQLPGKQRWILHDRDSELVSRAGAGMPDGVTTKGEVQDITRLRASDLGGTSLVTASALLDVLTADELAVLVKAIVGARVPAMFALSVVGRVDFDPVDTFDMDLVQAFNDHQRRTVDGRRLLGPDAVDTAVDLFKKYGATVVRKPSPWRLGPEDSALVTEWLPGWVAAAVEQRLDLAIHAQAYLDCRLDDTDLRVVVHHEDILALPAGT
jgi:hypothetical protein